MRRLRSMFVFFQTGPVTTRRISLDTIRDAAAIGL